MKLIERQALENRLERKSNAAYRSRRRELDFAEDVNVVDEYEDCFAHVSATYQAVWELQHKYRSH